MWSEQIIFVYYSPRGGLLESQSKKRKFCSKAAACSVFFALVGGLVARTSFVHPSSLVGRLYDENQYRFCAGGAQRQRGGLLELHMKITSTAHSAAHGQPIGSGLISRMWE